jgi:hypothetical protein
MAEAAAAVVPNGETRLKSMVFLALGVDEKRLSAPRLYRINRVFVETRQISANYDISWKTSASEGRPAAGRDRRIYAVEIKERQVRAGTTEE